MSGKSAGEEPEARLQFLGAAQNVTGSRFLLDTAGLRLLVDCGMYQERQLADRNWQPFPVPPHTIDAVLLTHAHIDHAGYLPRLVRDGFNGRVYCTAATAEVAQVLLLDAAHLQEEDAAFKKRRHEREGRRGPHPEAPLYTTEDAKSAIGLFTAVPYRREIELGPGVFAVFRDAGHVLGSSSIRVRFPVMGGERSITFSGDQGRPDVPVLHDPDPLLPSDFVVVESTYGDRTHPQSETIESQLATIINRAADAGGNVVVPAFALERAQEVLYHLGRLRETRRIPPLRTFVDSPMATEITRLFHRFPGLLDEGARPSRSGDSPFLFPGLTFVGSVEESKSINRVEGSTIIVAGAGMCNGGRIKHHLIANIGKPESAILFVGYQAQGTLGRHIVDGDRTVRILGQQYDVRARIERIEGFSAHADRDDLLAWLTEPGFRPRQVFVVHGEEGASKTFAANLRASTGWDVCVPVFEESFDLGAF